MSWLPWLCVLYAHGPTSLCMCEAGTESQHDHLILIAVVQCGMRFFGERSIYCSRTRAKDKCYVFSCGDSWCHCIVNPWFMWYLYQFMEKKYFTVSMYYILEFLRKNPISLVNPNSASKLSAKADGILACPVKWVEIIQTHHWKF